MRCVRFLCWAIAVSGLAISTLPAFADNPPGRFPLANGSPNWTSGGETYWAVGGANFSSQSPASYPSYANTEALAAYYQSPPGNPPMAPTAPAVTTPQDIYNGLQAGPATGDCGCGSDSDCGCCRHCFLYGYAGGLIMTRNEPNKVWLTYDQTNNNFQNLNTEMANVHWDGGAEFTIGYACCGDGGIELTYWGVWNMNGSASITDPTNNLGTPIDTTNGAAGLLLGGQTPDSFFTNAHQVFIWRNDQVNNVEINLTYNPWGYDNCGWNATWLAGIRCFNFDENLLWTSVAGGFSFGSNGGANQANLNVHCENDMVGFQFGAVFNYRFGDHFSMFFIPKMGIYGDAAETRSRYYRGDGVVGFDITGTKDTCSFLGEVDLGMKYDIGCHWSLVGGYRVVAVSGIALADNQIPHFLAASDEFADVKTNGDLILHGAFFGASFHY